MLLIGKVTTAMAVNWSFQETMKGANNRKSACSDKCDENPFGEEKNTCFLTHPNTF